MRHTPYPNLSYITCSNPTTLRDVFHIESANDAPVIVTETIREAE